MLLEIDEIVQSLPPNIRYRKRKGLVLWAQNQCSHHCKVAMFDKQAYIDSFLVM